MFFMVSQYAPKLLHYAAQTTDHYSLQEGVGLNSGLLKTEAY